MTWLSTNISERWNNPNSDFKVTIMKSNFEKVPFDVAVDNVIKDISSQKIFVAFSGGYDSEFIIRRLHRLKVDFVPVLIDLEGLEIERLFAYKALRELKIEAKVIKLSLSDFLWIYYEKIYKTINGTAWPSAQYLSCEYVTEEKGLWVDGGHILGDGEDIISQQNYYLPEWDFYCSTLFPTTKICNFFLHTPQIAYASLQAVSNEDLTWSDYKERVFQVRYRPKIRPQCYFDKRVRDILKQLEEIRLYKPNTKTFFGTKENLLSMISD
jgi:hypothetical protein